MYQMPDAAATWLHDHHGVATTAKLDDLGVGKAARRRLEHNGVLRRVERGTFVLVGAPSTLAQRCAIQCAAHPAGFITGPSAGLLADLRRMPQAASVHLAVPHGRRLPPVLGVTYRQTRALRPADRRERDDGIVVASWPRLAFDLAADLRQLDHESVVQQLLDRRRVTTEELLRIGERLCHPARPGSTTFEVTVAGLTGGRAQQSHAEVRVAAALRAAGVPVEPQVPIVVPGRWTLHLDLGVAAARWGVELDIHPEHRTKEGAASDAERRSIAIEAEWIVETATELDVRPQSVAGLVERLARSYRRALARPRRVGGDDACAPTLQRPPTLR